jgi:hypothetical protein
MSNHSEHLIQMVEVNGAAIKLIGNSAILQQPLLGLFCSQKCPGELILKAYDVARQLRQLGQVVVSGFHSPLEKDLLSILLRGDQPVVMCLARDWESVRIPKDQKVHIDKGQLLLISPVFKQTQNRITRQTAEIRNALIVQICSQVLLIHAEPGGNLDQLFQKWVADRREVFALRGRSNQHLFERGVKVWESSDLVSNNLTYPNL